MLVASALGASGEPSTMSISEGFSRFGRRDQMYRIGTRYNGRPPARCSSHSARNGSLLCAPASSLAIPLV